LSITHHRGAVIHRPLGRSWSSLGEVGDPIPRLFRLDDDVVDVRLYDAAYQLPKDTSYALLESGTRVLEPEGHHLATVRTDRSDECSCELVRYAHRYLVVPGVRIEKTEDFASSR
jgi:hypothetical protein